MALRKQQKESINFASLANKTGPIANLDSDNGPHFDVWSSVDLVERLLLLSEEYGLFVPVRRVFEQALKEVPEHLLISISLAKPYSGQVMLDELLSILLPMFFGEHPNSTPVLHALFKSNKKLFVRAVCELGKHDQKTLSLARILDIT